MSLFTVYRRNKKIRAGEAKDRKVGWGRDGQERQERGEKKEKEKVKNEKSRT